MPTLRIDTENAFLVPLSLCQALGCGREWAAGTSPGFGARRLEFRLWLVCHWANHFTMLGFGFLICTLIFLILFCYKN